MLAVTLYRSEARYGLVRASRGDPRVAAGELSLLHFGGVPEPVLPGPSWLVVRPRLAGICGSDLAAVTGHASLYLAALTSYPFVPGHEVVGETARETGWWSSPCSAAGCGGSTRPARSARPDGPDSASGSTAGMSRWGSRPDTAPAPVGVGGEKLVAHHSQLHPVPDVLSDEAAVLIEPFSCAVHAALRARVASDERVLVNGAGTMGLLTLAAVRAFTTPGRCWWWPSTRSRKSWHARSAPTS